MNEDKNQERDVSRELAEALKRAEDNLRGWQRAVADFANYKRRDQEYHAELVAYGQEQVINRFLAVLEDLDRTLLHAPQTGEDWGEWKKGLEGVRQNLHNTLHDLGVEKVKTVGERFNPDYHEAVERVEGGEEGVVAEEIAPGYKRGERLLKAAQVKVYKQNEDKEV